MQRNSRLRRLATEEDGFSLVFVGLGFMAFLGVSMLAIDVGMLMTARSQAQNSADAGALAGATALAYDDWDDRTETGPAAVNAIAGAQANQVMGGTVTVAFATDIQWPLDPAGEANRVRVTVHRTVDTLIAKYFGIATADIVAVATGEAAAANAMTCVKPFTIPDKWLEKNPITKPWDSGDTFERYYQTGSKKGQLMTPADVYVPQYTPSGCDPTKNCTPNPGYSGYNQESNRGQQLVLRAAIGTNINPSFYYSLAMTGDTGGADYDWNIANCNHSIYHWGDPLVQEPGAKVGPTVDGIAALIARDPGAYWENSPGCNCVKGSAYPERKSPRIFPIPLYDPDYRDDGQANGRVASLITANWIGYFVERIQGSNEIYGRIIPIGGIRDKTMVGGTASMPKAIRLVE